MDDLRIALNCNICQPPWAGYCIGHDSGSVYRNVVSLPCTSSDMYRLTRLISLTRQVTRATHVRTRVCPRVELILKIIIILLIIFLGFIKSKPC